MRYIVICLLFFYLCYWTRNIYGRTITHFGECPDYEFHCDIECTKELEEEECKSDSQCCTIDAQCKSYQKCCQPSCGCHTRCLNATYINN